MSISNYERIISSKSPRFYLKNYTGKEALPTHIMQRRAYAKFVYDLNEDFYADLFDVAYEYDSASIDTLKVMFGFSSI